MILNNIPNDGIVYRFAPDSVQLSVAENIQNNVVKVFPNPVVDELNLEVDRTDNSEAMLTIHDANGRLMQQQQIAILNRKANVDFSDLVPGIYILSVQQYKERLGTVRLVKK